MRFADHNHAVDAFPKEDELSFFMDLGSIFSGAENSADEIEKVLSWLIHNCQHRWQWIVNESVIYRADDNGKTTLPDGSRVSVSDMRRRLWINFDSRDDAMLSRITLVDLRNARYANCGILSSSIS